MTAAGALILYPSWAIAVVLAATVARLGRATGLGLLVVCSLLAMWITSMILVELPATHALAEHVVPLGMLQAGGYIHAGLDLTGRPARFAWLGYGWGAVIGIAGAIWPRALYGPGLVGPGPAFWPIVIVAGIGAIAVLVWLIYEAARRDGLARRQIAMLAIGNGLAIASGGGALLLHVVGVLHDLQLTTPALLGAALVISIAVVRGEVGPARRMIVQTLRYAVMAAALTAVGVTGLILALPALAPGAGFVWTAFVAFTAALALDAVRTLVVDSAGRRLFVAPIGVRDLAEQAEASEVRADQAARLAELGALVSAVAHEVRNPLGVISAHAKLLERAGAPAASLDAVRAQVRRASRFVDELLAYGKPRPLTIAALDVRAVIDEAVTAVRAIHPDAAITVAVAPRSHAVADRAALLDVLVNLIGNAAIAVAAHGSVTVTAAGVHPLELAVVDDGPGVPPELAPRLFQPFVTGRGRDHAHPGTGLGLATARSIAERHGGTLHHEPVPTGGARFILRLPGA